MDRVTAPILYPIQRVVPLFGGIDISPFIAMLLIELMKGLLVRAILNLGG
ncbi:Integral membrane protein YggT [Acidithiobacillus caldus ATCC 51756]|uniref:Integral membrane protein YggT n=1 Tax=Acidithiobacillus caldus (strain ATCC 51756 / DSM 8584 / KU) TaxID=637389 RepID=A0A059ZXY1_ACICK|nr:Integral membrane protein YggT [Acidithiobacillus caldus ATCC 51756]